MPKNDVLTSWVAETSCRRMCVFSRCHSLESLSTFCNISSELKSSANCVGFSTGLKSKQIIRKSASSSRSHLHATIVLIHSLRGTKWFSSDLQYSSALFLSVCVTLMLLNCQKVFFCTLKKKRKKKKIIFDNYDTKVTVKFWPSFFLSFFPKMSYAFTVQTQNDIMQLRSHVFS